MEKAMAGEASNDQAEICVWARVWTKHGGEEHGNFWWLWYYGATQSSGAPEIAPNV